VVDGRASLLVNGLTPYPAEGPARLVPVVGFIDADGREVRFAEIKRGAGNFAGLPLPFVVALAKGYRASDHYGRDDVVSVTTIIGPVQATRLLERHEVFVEPLRNLWALFGTIGHAILEAGAAELDDVVTERRLVVERDGQLVGGTFDLIEKVDGELVGRDYKVTAAFGVSKMKTEGVYKGKPEYFWQAQLYRLLLSDPDALEVIENDDGSRSLVRFEHAGIGRDIKRWQLCGWSRDWNERTYGRTLKPVELVDVKPLLAIPRVENYLRERLTLYAASGLCDDDGLPACSSTETWAGRRCAKWCDAAGVCAQLKRKAAR
jgi:hypothetical protein